MNLIEKFFKGLLAFAVMLFVVTMIIGVLAFSLILTLFSFALCLTPVWVIVLIVVIMVKACS